MGHGRVSGPYGHDVEFAVMLLGAAVLCLLVAAVGEAIHDYWRRER
jgi:hypothetical protein